jgi:hypothetical protein
MKLHQVFEKYGVNYSSEEVDNSLANLEFEELLDITDELLSEPVEFKEDDDTQSMIIRYALLNAFNAERDSLMKEDFEVGRQKVEELSDITVSPPDDSVEPVKVKTEVKRVKKVKAVKTKRSESKAEFEELKQYISDNPDMIRREFIDTMKVKHPRLSEGTIGQYFYTIRKELGLKANGARGRPQNNTNDKVKEIYQRMKGSDHKEVKAAIAEELGLTEKTAVVYYCRIKKELGDV